MDKKANIRVFETPELMSDAAAEFIVLSASVAITARGKFVISLSGGRTPSRLYTLLSSALFKERIEWNKVFVFWGDERCVPIDDERNNAHMAKTLLLDKIEISSTNIYSIPVDMKPAEAAKKYEQILRDFFGKSMPSFDLILLGLGDNGHTASLFPGTDVLKETRQWVKEVYVDEQKEWRITMTAPLIDQARNIAFLVSGKEKAEILQAVLNGPLLPDLYPAQMISTVNGSLYWFIDKTAVSNNNFK